MLGAGNKTLSPSRRGASSVARSDTDSSVGGRRGDQSELPSHNTTTTKGRDLWQKASRISKLCFRGHQKVGGES